MSPNKAKILVVDDDATLLLTLEALLTKAGYDVVTTSDPKSVLPIAERGVPDAVILDIVMPELSGWEILDEIRGRAELDATPVLLLSALDEPAHRVRGLRAGAEDFLVKPFDGEELLARLEVNLSRRARGSSGLHGLFEIQPIQELVQSLENNAKTGELHVYAGGLAGGVRIHAGKFTDAEWGGYEDATAVQAILELRTGQFRFAPGDFEAGEDVEGFSFFPLLMQEAWAADELQSRRDHLPPSTAPLQLSPPSPPAEPFPHGLERLPARRVLDYLEAHPGTTTEELVAERFGAPRMVILAVAWLRELGRIDTTDLPEPRGEVSELLDGALRALFLSAATRGFAPEELEVRFLVEPGAWDSLAPLLAEIDDALLHPSERKSKGRIFVDRGGRLRLFHEAGLLTVRFETLGTSPEGLKKASGVVLWLAADPDTGAAAAYPPVSSFSPEAALLCVAPNGKVHKQAESQLGKGSGWTYLAYLPKTLQDLLLVLTYTTA